MGCDRRWRGRDRNGAGRANSAIRVAGRLQMVCPCGSTIERHGARLVYHARVGTHNGPAVRGPGHGLVVNSGNNAGYRLIATAWGNRSFWIDIDALSQEWQRREQQRESE